MIGWREATHPALYGDGGFYRSGAGPAAHFRTSVHATPLFAEAVLRLARSADLHTIVDIGSGRGELLRTLRGLDPSLQLVGVELADRPDDLPADVAWLGELAGGIDGLVIGNEWLDNVPVDAAVVSEDGWRRLLVNPATGDEQQGECVAGADLEWLEDWWPAGQVGDRAEIGRPRDDAWAAAVGSLSRGIAVAVDYCHSRSARPQSGSLAGFRGGRQVDPVPDGSCDITSHVALDSCAAAGQIAGQQAGQQAGLHGRPTAGPAAGTGWTVLTDQRSMLHTLLGATPPPPYDLATREPAAYLAALSRASQAADLTRSDGLGGFGWLLQGVGVPKPAGITGGTVPRPDRGQLPSTAPK
jgi:SAM-dependent MidA family methyltransferase